MKLDYVRPSTPTLIDVNVRRSEDEPISSDAVSLAKDLGLEGREDFVARNYDKLNTLNKTRRVREDVADAPVTQGILAGSQGRADIPHASEMAELERESSAWFHLSTKAEQGLAQESGAEVIWNAMERNPSVEELNQLVAPQLEILQRETEAPNALTYLAGETLQMAGQYLGDTTTQFGMGLQLLGSAISAIPTPPTIAVGQITRAGGAGISRYGMVTNAYQNETAWAYHEFRNIQGEDGEYLDPQTAKIMAHTYGAISTGFELYGLKKTVGATGLGKAEFAKRFKDAYATAEGRSKILEYARTLVEGPLAEGFTEAMQGMTQVLIGQYGEVQVGNEFNLDGMVNEMWESAKAGAAAAVLPGVVRTGVNIYQDKPWVKEAPDTAATVMERTAAANGHDGKVHVDPEGAVILKQSINDNQIEVSPELQAELDEAIDGDSLVSVNASDFARVSPYLEEGFAQHVTPDTSQPTAYEQAAIDDSQMAEMDELPEVIEETPIYEQKLDEQLKAGVPMETAKANAKISTAFTYQFARETGQDPQALAAKLTVGQERRGAGAALEQAAYHGTPHRFDAFSLNAIGTGEGAQAFGWGLYFAGDRGVAEGYREALSQPAAPISVDGKPVDKIYTGDIRETWPELYEGLVDDTAINEEKLYFLDSVPEEQRDAADTAYDELVELYKSGDYSQMREEAIVEKFPEGYAPDTDQLYESITSDVEALDEVLANLSQIGTIDDVDYVVEGLSENAQEVYSNIVAPRLEEMEGAQGQLYRVDVPEDSELLDYDAEVSGEYGVGAKILEAAKEDDRLDYEDFADALGVSEGYMGQPEAGSTIYDLLSSSLGGPQQASEFLRDIGVPGLMFWDRQSRREQEGTRNYVIWDEGRVQITDTFYQDARGLIEIMPEGEFHITLTGDADASTFIHEFGHYALEMYKGAVADGTATEGVKADYQAIMDYVGNDGGEITVAQHEKLAEAFESYLMEGKAPDTQLEGAFRRLSRLILRVYRGMLRRVQLNPDIRGVFDRMLVGQREVLSAAQESVAPIDTANVEGIPLAMTERIRKLTEETIQEAQDLEMTKARENAKRYHKKKYRKAEREAKKAVTEEVNAMPVYQADSFLTSGKSDAVPPVYEGMKLDTAEVKEVLGVEKLSQSMKGRTSTDNSMNADEMAPLFGYETGYELINDLANRENKQALIARMTDERVVAEMGDSTLDTAVIDAGMEAVHNSKYESLLVAELEAMTGQKMSKRLQNIAAKQQAKSILDGKRRGDIYPNKYYRAAATNARKAQEAAMQGKNLEAADFIRKQLLNHHLFKLSTEMNRRYDAKVKKLRQTAKLKSMAQVRKGGQAFEVNPADVITAILGKAGIIGDTGQDPSQMLAALDTEVRDMGMASVIDPAVQVLDVRLMTYDQMMAVAGNVGALVKLGKDFNEFTIMGERIARDELIKEMRDTISENVSTKKSFQDLRKVNGDPGAFAKTRGIVNRLHAWAMKMPSIAWVADGENTEGVFHRTFVIPARILESQFKDKHKELSDQVEDILGSTLRTKRMNTEVPFMGQQYTRAQIMAILWNIGNDSNLKKLVDGTLNVDENGDPVGSVAKDELPAWRQRIATAIEGALTPTEVQQAFEIAKVLDRFDNMAAVTERVTGKIVQKVEPVPVTVHGITSEGYYFPVKYSDGLTAKGNVIHRTQNSNKGVSSMVDGFTKERVTAAIGPLDLNPSIVSSHLESVLHYETYLEYLTSIDKLVNDKNFKVMINDTLGPEVYDMSIMDWVTVMASNGNANVFALNTSRKAESMASKFRRNITTMRMSYNMGVASTQFYGMINSISMLSVNDGPGRTLKAMLGAVADPMSAYRVANEKSTYMRHRLELQNSNMHDNLRAQQAAFDGRYREFTGMVDSSGFAPIQAAQGVVDYMTWAMAYSIASSTMTDAQAVSYADSIVERTQGSGGLKDRTPVENASELVRGFNMHYSYWGTAYGQLASAVTRLNPRKNDIPTMAKALAETAGYWVGPALVMTLVAVALSDEEEDTDEVLIQVAAETMKSVKSAIPFVRNIPATMFGVDDWPGQSVFDDIVQHASRIDLSDGASLSEVRAASKLIAASSGFPADKVFILYVAMALMFKGNFLMSAAWLTGQASWWDVKDEI